MLASVLNLPAKPFKCKYGLCYIYTPYLLYSALYLLNLNLPLTIELYLVSVTYGALNEWMQ